MTPENQRIAIAEACGWYDLVKQDVSLFGKLEPESQKTFELDVPDYLDDLNAMHEAEKTLGDPQLWEEYGDNLERAMGEVGWIYHATASQRAEAFLRTLNLWKP